MAKAKLRQYCVEWQFPCVTPLTPVPLIPVPSYWKGWSPTDSLHITKSWTIPRRSVTKIGRIELSDVYDAYGLEDLVSASQTLALATQDYSTQRIDWAQTFTIFSSKAQACSESLKAYKSLDDYYYYVNGWVSSITVFEVPCSTDAYLCSIFRTGKGFSASVCFLRARDFSSCHSFVVLSC